MKKTIYLFTLSLLFIFTSCGDTKPTLTNAAIVVQDDVKIYFAADCDFDDLDIRGQETSPNHFTVYQPFTSSRTGYSRRYIYKANAVFNGGDKYLNNNWSISDIIVEDQGTGRQWRYK